MKRKALLCLLMIAVVLLILGGYGSRPASARVMSLRIAASLPPRPSPSPEETEPPPVAAIFKGRIKAELDKYRSTQSPAPPAGTPLVAGPPPWLDFGADCQPVSTTSASSGSFTLKAERDEGRAGAARKGQPICWLKVIVCGDSLVRSQAILPAAGAACPASLQAGFAPLAQVCCSAWQAAVLSKLPCDPLLDADCDGKSNQTDDYLLDSSR